MMILAASPGLSGDGGVHKVLRSSIDAVLNILQQVIQLRLLVVVVHRTLGLVDRLNSRRYQNTLEKYASVAGVAYVTVGGVVFKPQHSTPEYILRLDLCGYFRRRHGWMQGCVVRSCTRTQRAFLRFLVVAVIVRKQACLVANFQHKHHVFSLSGRAFMVHPSSVLPFQAHVFLIHALSMYNPSGQTKKATPHASEHPRDKKITNPAEVYSALCDICWHVCVA